MRLLHATDLINLKEATEKHCLTDRMRANHNKKPLAGKKFNVLRDCTVNSWGRHHLVGQQECVGETHIKQDRYIKKKDSSPGI